MEIDTSAFAVAGHSYFPAQPISTPSTDEASIADEQSEDDNSFNRAAAAKPLPGSAEATTEALRDPNSAESQLLKELKNRDREVRAHEQAHVSAAGQYARGGPVYEYQKGPDGRRYAVGGHVSIDTAAIPGDPEATLRKAETVRRAALAPAEPSAQDRRVAAEASSMALEARQEIQRLRLEEMAVTRESQQPARPKPNSPRPPTLDPLFSAYS